MFLLIVHFLSTLKSLGTDILGRRVKEGSETWRKQDEGGKLQVRRGWPLSILQPLLLCMCTHSIFPDPSSTSQYSMHLLISSGNGYLQHNSIFALVNQNCIFPLKI